MSKLEIALFPCLSDNYGLLIHDPQSGKTAAIDTPDADEITRQCEARNWGLTDIWNTHHHWDHTGGNLALKEKYGVNITGPNMIEGRIPGLDIGVGEADIFQFGHHDVKVWHTPGHTKDHIVYYVPDAEAIFVGDTLFAMGCGRLFEGTPLQMFESLKKLASLPPETKVYCAHEYTVSNGEFAITVESENPALRAALGDAKTKRTKAVPTIPTTISKELETNPFMRAETPEILGQIRAAKDNF
ncbi:hydroxyacylglutathione hydrolase [Litorimonas taeanensis]|uniref:Hydroxyacylglutathione hydrolase n=1 Tax=Litorimonas taeanensis TaxID=568099 RepID=A0A420WCY0_9PROT|nr:hydroxyacylglutathione hydrolase [Litorimonas taeanensis]RKQ68828.1 hydroxyacylglutathione hydrolase [Litorimonas taeanensis]